MGVRRVKNFEVLGPVSLSSEWLTPRNMQLLHMGYQVEFSRYVSNGMRIYVHYLGILLGHYLFITLFVPRSLSKK